MKRRILAVVMLTITIISSGCSFNSNVDELMKEDKQSVVQKYRLLEASYLKISSEYSDYKQKVAGIYGEEASSVGISEMGDGTGRYTFTSADSKIVFSKPFEYPNTSSIASDGYICVAGGVQLTAQDNWINNITGTELTMEHSTGISGTIKVGKTIAVYDADHLKTDVFEPWVSQLPPDKVKYSQIFISSTKSGLQVVTPTYVDGSDAYLRCGMFAYGQYCISYTFLYRGAQNTTKDELIKTVLNSLAINGTKITVE